VRLAIDTPGAIALAPSQISNPSSSPTPQGLDNGLLTNADILNLDLRSELVVLSACDTGRGTLTGDGVLGLSRSWLAAGVKNVVVSLWAVNDEATAMLMEEFYRSFQRQPDSAIALRQAMLATRKQHPGPKFWSAFTVVGP
jgi:CHAT domain-containing protein